ncbi:hypothetical protein GAN87_17390, partial [Bacteroides thetaiotaomicron]
MKKEHRTNMKVVVLILSLFMPICMMADEKKATVGESDRKVWCDILYRMAEPVLKNMSEGKLQQN